MHLVFYLLAIQPQRRAPYEDIRKVRSYLVLCQHSCNTYLRYAILSS
jgi:hypothetical protein